MAPGKVEERRAFHDMLKKGGFMSQIKISDSKTDSKSVHPQNEAHTPIGDLFVAPTDEKV